MLMSGTGLLLLNYQGAMTRSNGVQVIIDKLGRFQQHYLDHFLWVQHPWGVKNLNHDRLEHGGQEHGGQQEHGSCCMIV